jgi:hypothetical protein
VLHIGEVSFLYLFVVLYYFLSYSFFNNVFFSRAKLLKHFDAQQHEAECEKVLTFLFSSRVYDTAMENIKDENIDEDLCLYWRVYCDFIKQSEVRRI